MKWDAQRYDTVKAPQIDAGRELIALARIREHDDILDLGCGTGRLTVELARLAPKGSVAGLDPSEEMLEKARMTIMNAGNLRLIQGQAENMVFTAEFDLVFSNSAVHWMQDQSRAARAVHRALRSGGRIAFQMPARNFCPPFFACIETAMSELGYERFFRGWRSPWHFPGTTEFGATLSDAGFRSVDVFTKNYALLFVSPADVVEWWASAGLRPYLAALPQNAQHYFLDAIGECFERKRTGNGIAFDFTRLFAFAHKA